jgi:hypothetical protein
VGHRIAHPLVPFFAPLALENLKYPRNHCKIVVVMGLLKKAKEKAEEAAKKTGQVAEKVGKESVELGKKGVSKTEEEARKLKKKL